MKRLLIFLLFLMLVACDTTTGDVSDVSQDNGVYTFLNQFPKNFNFDEVDQTKMAYTNILNV